MIHAENGEIDILAFIVRIERNRFAVCLNRFPHLIVACVGVGEQIHSVGVQMGACGAGLF